MKRSLAFFIFSLYFLLVSIPAFSQALKQNLSNIKVDELSDTQVMEYYEKFKKSGLSMTDMEAAATARGMGTEEINKLKARITQLQQNYTPSFKNPSYNFGEQKREVNTQTPKSTDKKEPETFFQDSSAYKFEDVFQTLEKKVYGSSLFNNQNLTFEPSLNIPTPKNYQLGPDDELQIDVFGATEANYKLKVSPEGMIRIPLVAPVSVSGLTIEQATEVIENRLSQIFSGINDGSTHVTVSLGNIRSIKVIVMGEAVMPGTYTLPSLASVFNALYSCGGPSENGSYRNIQLIRNNKVISTIDIYSFLSKGDQKGNLRLEDQDVIKINPYANRISIFGEVKSQGYFETLEKETFKDLLKYAGGFTDKAYTGIVKVLKNNKKERSIADIKEADFGTYAPQSGDRFIVEKILEKFSNRLVLRGAVYREGPFEMEDGLTLTSLIKKADGLRGDAFLDRGYIKRTKEDYTTEFITFSLKNIFNGTDPDIVLTKDDEINIPSALEIKEQYTIKVEGEVLQPGEFFYSEKMTLEDVILMAGGLKDAATLNRVEIARRIRTQDENPDKKAEIYTFDLSPNLSKLGAEEKFYLKPFDIISIRRSPFYQPQEKITMEGEVLYPGNYIIESKSARVSNLIKRAGGFTPEAYPLGAVLIRRSETSKTQKEIAAQKLKKLAEGSGDSLAIDVNEITSSKEFVGIQLEKIMKNPGSKHDLLLRDGDIIRIPPMLQTVKVAGEVFFPVSIRYVSGKRARYYIQQSGGFTEGAKKSKIYVVNANGSVSGTGNFLFFLKYPKVYPGSEIIVPQKIRREKLSTQEILAITSTLTSMALVLLTALNFLNK